MAHTEKERNELKKRVSRLREDLGINQTEFAALVGVKQSVVSTWESGGAFPSGQNYFRLGSLSSREDDRGWFWEQAGIDLEALDRYIDERIKTKKVASPSEFVSISPLDPRDKESIPFPSRFLVNPSSTRFVRVKRLKATKTINIRSFKIEEQSLYPDGDVLLVESGGLENAEEGISLAIRLADNEEESVVIIGRLHIMDMEEHLQFWLDLPGGRQFIGTQVNGSVNLLGRKSVVLGRVIAWMRDRKTEGK